MTGTLVLRLSIVVVLGCVLLGCAGHNRSPQSGEPEPATHRVGDEIMICGQLFHTGTRVVLWSDPGGYNAYARDGRPASDPEVEPLFFGQRRVSDIALRKRVESGGWTLPDLQRQVDQFVLHYDAAGTSEQCFRILHQKRGLSVHFMLDLDGTIYQTLDLKERAWHATRANDRSVGIEIANIGAYPPRNSEILDRWYTGAGFDRRVVPPQGTGSLHTPGFIARPARSEAVVGRVQGRWLRMYDLTNEQYEALMRLVAALNRVFPEIRIDYPREPSGELITHVLDDDAFDGYQGLLGHFHVQQNKVDPGPAFDWDRVVEGARSLVGERRAGVSTRPGRPTRAYERGGGSLRMDHDSEQ